MKKYFYFLVVMFIGISTTFGQFRTINDQEKVQEHTHIYMWNGDKVEATPGNLLQKASTNILGGVACLTAGSGLLVLNMNEPKEDNSFKYLGYGTILVGVFLELRGVWLIGESGKIMEKDRQKSISYKISPTGVGLALNF